MLTNPTPNIKLAERPFSMLREKTLDGVGIIRAAKNSAGEPS